ncbi:MAG: hypothetical protein ACPGTS_02475, partial [Minisyncoccia bacterium]
VIVKLKDLLRAFHFIWGLQYDVTNLLNFRIEHEYYYHRGGSYNSDLIGSDITSQIEPHSLKPWSYKTKKWNYEKSEIPGFIKRSWSDEVSDFFEGQQIEILSVYAEKERGDDDPIPLITTDIDYMSNNPERISNNGLALFECNNSNEIVEYEFENEYLNVTQTFQNGNLSMTVLQQRFGRYQLPAKNVRINDEETTALTVKRTVTQNLRIKLDQYLPPEKLIITSKGTGKIAVLRQFIRTGENRITVKHDSEI